MNPDVFPAERFVIAIGTSGDGAGYRFTPLGDLIADQIVDSLCDSATITTVKPRYTDPCSPIDEQTGGMLVNPIAIARVGVINSDQTALEISDLPDNQDEFIIYDVVPRQK